MDCSGRATARYKHAPGLPFRPEYGGGVNLPQVYARPLNGSSNAVTFTDDLIFAHKKGVIQLLILVDKAHQAKSAIGIIDGVGELSCGLIRDEEAIVLVNDLAASRDDVGGIDRRTVARIASGDEFIEDEKLCKDRPAPTHYNPHRIRDELRASVRFVLIRGDKFVFAACTDREELEDALRSLQTYLHGQQMSRHVLPRL